MILYVVRAALAIPAQGIRTLADGLWYTFAVGRRPTCESLNDGLRARCAGPSSVRVPALSGQPDGPFGHGGGWAMTPPKPRPQASPLVRYAGVDPGSLDHACQHAGREGQGLLGWVLVWFSWLKRCGSMAAMRVPNSRPGFGPSAQAGGRGGAPRDDVKGFKVLPRRWVVERTTG